MMKIAVVEDNPDNRLLVRVILEALYQVTEYEDGFRALEGLQREKPDLLLLDISLPEMDGMEVLRRIRTDATLRDLPVIALTAHAMSGDREKYLAAGFDDYVTKPIVDEAVLLNAIQARLAHSPAPPPAPCHVTEAGALDGAALERLRKLGGDAFAADMIGMFLEYTAKKISEGLQAQAAGDLTGVQNAMHPIKSSAGNIGAMQVSGLAARIEGLAKDRQGEAMPSLLAEIEQSFATLKPQLEAARQSLLKS